MLTGDFETKLALAIQKGWYSYKYQAILVAKYELKTFLSTYFARVSRKTTSG